MQVSAVLSNARLSAQKKARLVADLVRGKPVEQALNILLSAEKGRSADQESTGVRDCQRRAQRRR